MCCCKKFIELHENIESIVAINEYVYDNTEWYSVNNDINNLLLTSINLVEFMVYIVKGHRGLFEDNIELKKVVDDLKTGLIKLYDFIILQWQSYM